MMRYVLVPGYGGSSEGHWQHAWREELGENAVTISPVSWHNPDLDDWVNAIHRAVTASAVADEGPIMLIAHSLGCWAVSAWCSTPAANPAALLMLVAPPDPRSTAFPHDDAPSFLTARAEPLHRPGVVIFSEDDPYCTPTKARSFAEGWGVQALSMGAQGHLNTASGLNTWEAGRHIRDQLAGQGTSGDHS